MKTTIRKIATGTFIALLLMVGNVKASETETASLKATESSLELENWMTNEIIWNTNSLINMEFVREMETSLELENWMTNANTWNANTFILEEFEAELQIEDWMTNDETWNLKDMDVEQTLTVENWMINDNIWQ